MAKRQKWHSHCQVRWVKVNCDGSFGKAATGIVIRDEHEKLLNGIGRRVLADEALTVEALAIKDGCKLAREKGYEKIVMESDFAGVMGDINRKNGRAADWVSKQYNMGIDLMTWVDRPPSSLVHILNKDGLPCPH
ncbi:hypothetical protein COLO4_35238 [Corchorus olitorius]|uniref:RNase H type-1 domain-containing protein n=1 Tax=Corchorus olitorius TaxID=93759 RepID=A0A1R3GHV7_9ROSI|nr:hypothetical protein COLO4_35238 [Corchorus olitorius]